jgi:hypothetical protein
VTGSGNSTATGGTSSATGGSSTAAGGNATGGNAAGGNSSNALTVEGDSSSTNYQAPRIPVATAYAPNVMPTALCTLGVSAGAQGVSFGLSFGSSFIDTNCQQLEQVRTTAAVLGDRATAAEMMCSISETYRDARAATGRPCLMPQAAARSLSEHQPVQPMERP